MTKNWIPISRMRGKSSKQAHTDLPENTYEREFSKEGFFGPAAFLYHKNPPTNWVSFEGSLKPRAFNLKKLPEKGLSKSNQLQTSPWRSNIILYNAHCEMRYFFLTTSMESLARNGDGDLLIFVHQGKGDLFCDYGHLAYEPGDYLYLPRGSMWRFETKLPSEFLMIEASNTHYYLPDKGILGGHALFDPAVLDVPEINDQFISQQDDQSWKIEVKKNKEVSVITYPYNPLDAVGWHGELAPVRLNIRDIRPLLSHRYHLPPSAHTTFLSDRFVVCTFTPRPFETDPKALKVPFFHNNDDYEEVLFYHAGDFFSRDNIAPGMMTFHPSGFTHGPHPKALKKMFEQTKESTDEYAVMIDTRDPLKTTNVCSEIELKAYADSWKVKD